MNKQVNKKLAEKKYNETNFWIVSTHERTDAHSTNIYLCVLKKTKIPTIKSTKMEQPILWMLIRSTKIKSTLNSAIINHWLFWSDLYIFVFSYTISFSNNKITNKQYWISMASEGIIENEAKAKAVEESGRETEESQMIWINKITKIRK